MSTVANIQQAIETLEQQRALLGDAAVNAAIATLKKQLNEKKQTAERKLVTVMFADISGFTALSEKRDPEEVRSLMNQCFDKLVPIVLKYNGTIDKFIGDEIMALFGAPVANEKHAELACLCAIEIMKEIKKFNQQQSLTLGLHIGLNTGLVVAGGIGSEGRQQYSVMGDVVNLGSRLKDKARNGEIYTGEELYNITSQLFEFEKLTPVLLKGKAEPVQIFSLKGVLRESEKKQFSNNTPLIGRKKEIKILRETFDSLNNNIGAVIAIIGEAGIGKSRLLNENKQRISGDSGCFEGRAFSHLSQVSYRPVKEMLLNMMTEDFGEDQESMRSGLTQLLYSFDKEIQTSIFPFLASILGIPLTAEENAAIRYLDPASMRQRVQDSFILFIKIKTTNSPLILQWEDLHWADPETIHVIEKLCAESINIPLINILTFRPQKEELSWHLHEKLSNTLSGYKALILEPLSSKENIQLVQNLIGDKTRLLEAAKLIYEKSEGNPFYTEELFKVLHEQGYFQESETDPVLINKNLLPQTLQGIVASRIDRLTPDEKWILWSSSVTGRIIDLNILRSLAGIEQRHIDLQLSVKKLLESDLIRRGNENEETNGNDYYFKHAITQEVAYNTLLLSTRKIMHQRIADVMLNIYGADHYFIAADHFEKAENFEKAISIYRKSAEYAAGNFAHENELTCYIRASNLAEKRFVISGVEEQKAELRILLEKTGDIYNRQTNRDKALEYYEKALQLYVETNSIDRARLNRKKGLCYEVTHSVSADTIISFYNKADQILNSEISQTDQWYQEWIDLQLDKCWAFYWQFKMDELQQTIRNLEEPIGQHASLAQHMRFKTNKIFLDFRSQVFQFTQSTIDMTSEVIELSLQTNNQQMIANSWFYIGFVYLWANRIDESINIFENHISDSEKVGDRVIMTRNIFYMSIAYRRKGNVDRSEQLTRNYLDSDKYVRIPEYVAGAHGNLVWINWKKKNYDEMKSHYKTCAEYINTKAFNTPFSFIYIMPMVAFYSEMNDTSKIIPLLKELIQPHKRKMEPALQTAIEAVLNAFEENNKPPDTDSVKTIIKLAEQYLYL